MQLYCFSYSQSIQAVPIKAFTPETYPTWLEQQIPSIKNQIVVSKFKIKSGNYILLFQPDGLLKEVILGMDHVHDFWAFGNLSAQLPEGNYEISTPLETSLLNQAFMAWGLGSYQFKRYKSFPELKAKLVLKDEINVAQLESFINSIFWVRDLINTPTEDLGPQQLALEAEALAEEFKAEIKLIGKEKLKTEYPCIYGVGKGSDRDPCLVDIHWGNPDDPKVTLVGKGVCFDSGGYDLKPSSAMLFMKKDMAGAATALGLARLIMKAKLPIRLRILIPAVENLVSGRAYLPGAILNTRKGSTVEITNTDAEGRLILADALYEACNELPDLLIDFATLTGAATIALGGEISAFFTNRTVLAQKLMSHAEKIQEPLWELPLYRPYVQLLKSNVADICNADLSGKGGGAILGALFLEHFVKPEIPWIHFDLLAYNRENQPGRPKGGEAMCLRTVFSYLQEKYASPGT